MHSRSSMLQGSHARAGLPDVQFAPYQQCLECLREVATVDCEPSHNCRNHTHYRAEATAELTRLAVAKPQLPSRRQGLLLYCYIANTCYRTLWCHHQEGTISRMTSSVSKQQAVEAHFAKGQHADRDAKHQQPPRALMQPDQRFL
ncbi:hypothetical protein ABBQ38_013206 [Trebouxia sp. C0009 RCD-2024]